MDNGVYWLSAIGLAEPMVAEGHALKGIQEGHAVGISAKDVFFIVSPAGHVVNGARVFYAQGICHS